MRYIIIIGCGKTGKSLAQELATSHNVVVVDKSRRALDTLGEDFNGKKVVGDALDLDILEEAGIKEADALVLVTGKDNLNLVVGKIAKERYKVKKVALQIYEVNKKRLFPHEDLIIVNRTHLLVDVFKKCIL